MSTLLKPLSVRETLLERNMRIFTAQDFGRLFPYPSHSIKYFLEVQTRQGLFVRLKQGIYALKTDFPSEEEVANTLYKPSYISFEYALAYYNIIPEMTYSITSATTKSTRLFTLQEKAFGYYTIKKETYTGYTLVKTGNKSFLIAEPEKALADYLYYVSIGHRILNDRLDIRSIHKDMLREYALLYGREKLLTLIKTL